MDKTSERTISQAKAFFDFSSLLLTQKYHSPGTINKFPSDYYTATKKGWKRFLQISKAHMIQFSLHSLSYQTQAQIPPKPKMLKKKTQPTKNPNKKNPLQTVPGWVFLSRYPSSCRWNQRYYLIIYRNALQTSGGTILILANHTWLLPFNSRERYR